MGQRLKTIFVTNLRNGGIGMLEIIHNPLLTAFQHPFVDRFVEDGIKNTTECSYAISSHMGQFLYGFHPHIVLQNKILKAIGIL